ncbi:unnamed protein product [Bursaphelenchus okinawaensis]|uniref:Phospholipase A2 n=1 Tax=Bursaphelenchus okinawaensis TaxID=465554 RepID=A0A811LFY0_9BILA|nr:unnamed protein product [Bursaphelenchus okinawaensis]CAG9121715.1 unnamed protein product [Bursaphelenchus okinawaensis]
MLYQLDVQLKVLVVVGLISNVVGMELTAEMFECGTGMFTNTLAFKTAHEECPTKVELVNDCCRKHDKCYDNYGGPPQEECDTQFCDCIAAQQCGKIVELWCPIVKAAGKKAFNTGRLEGCLNQTKTELEEQKCYVEFDVEEELQKQQETLGDMMEKHGMAGRCIHNETLEMCTIVYDAYLGKIANTKLEGVCSCLASGLNNETDGCTDGYNKICTKLTESAASTYHNILVITALITVIQTFL